MRRLGGNVNLPASCYQCVNIRYRNHIMNAVNARENMQSRTLSMKRNMRVNSDGGVGCIFLPLFMVSIVWFRLITSYISSARLSRKSSSVVRDLRACE